MPRKTSLLIRVIPVIYVLSLLVVALITSPDPTGWAMPINLSLTTGTRAFLPLVIKSRIQSPRLKWQRGGCYTSWCETGWYSSPAVANIDGDQQAEVIAGTYDLYALDGLTGAVEWRVENSNRIWPGIALVDLTGDSQLEIIVGRSGNQLTVYKTNGSPIWTRSPFGDGEIRTLAIADLENDGKFEIMVGRASPGPTRQLNVYEPNGSIRPGWPARRNGELGYGAGMYNQNAAAADLNGDGFKEIIGPTDTHYITALDRNGNQLPTNPMYDVFNPVGPKVWSQVGVHVDHSVDLRGYANCGVEHRPNFADSAPTLADLDHNGTRKIIVVGNVYNCGTDPYTSLYQMPFVFNVDRSRWSGSGFNWTVIPISGSNSGPISEDYNVIETAEPNPVIADIDGNGFKEILFASYDGRLHAYWLDKTEHGQWPYRVNNPAEGFLRLASEPVVVDMNNDGLAEVIFASWTQKGSNHTGRLHILDYLGHVLYELDLPPGVSSDWNGALAAPTIANIDNDPELELVLLTAYSGVVAYDLSGTENARILWATGRGSYLRSGSD